MKLKICYCVTLVAFGTVISQGVKPTACGISVYWVDRRCPERRHEKAQIDTFFDRVVGIVIMNKPNSTRRNRAVGSGVYITQRLVLTSYNAYAMLAQRKDTMQDLRVYIVKRRRFNATGALLHYNIEALNAMTIACARQVIPQNTIVEIPDHMRHGIHCPLHDLMVIRMSRTEKFLEPVPPRRFDFEDYNRIGIWDETESNYYIESGPIHTEIARPEDEIGDDVMWASMGHIDDEHIRMYQFLELGKISIGEKVITNCDAWIPREWGHFICVYNKHKYAGLASGGVLFSDGKLFGIGSFALFKGAESILAFTDVRPYWHLLHRTCTTSDQNLDIPND